MRSSQVLAAWIDDTNRIAGMCTAAIEDVTAENPGMTGLHADRCFAVDANSRSGADFVVCGGQALTALLTPDVARPATLDVRLSNTVPPKALLSGARIIETPRSIIRRRL